MRTILIVAITLLLPIGYTVAQIPQLESPPNIPEGEGSWTLSIATSGGFTGQGRGNVTINSLGIRSCQLTRTTCSTPISNEKFAPLKQFATSFDAAKWPSPLSTTISLCSDCYVTTVTFTRRESGELKPYTFTWTVANQSSVPPDLIRIVAMALSGNL
jgi:hypothetical protein